MARGGELALVLVITTIPTPPQDETFQDGETTPKMIAYL